MLAIAVGCWPAVLVFVIGFSTITVTGLPINDDSDPEKVEARRTQVLSLSGTGIKHTIEDDEDTTPERSWRQTRKNVQRTSQATNNAASINDKEEEKEEEEKEAVLKETEEKEVVKSNSGRGINVDRYKSVDRRSRSKTTTTTDRATVDESGEQETASSKKFPSEKSLDNETDFKPSDRNCQNNNNCTKLEPVRSRKINNNSSASSSLPSPTTLRRQRISSNTYNAPEIATSTHSSSEMDLNQNVSYKKRRRPTSVSTTPTPQTMPYSLYNHFRPLDQDVPQDHLIPFLDFGKKLSPGIVPTPSGINSIESNKSNRYRTRDHYVSSNDKLYSTPEEDVVHENMDVTVMKKAIERNTAPRGRIQLREPVISSYYRRRPPTTTSSSVATTDNLVISTTECVLTENTDNTGKHTRRRLASPSSDNGKCDSNGNITTRIEKLQKVENINDNVDEKKIKINTSASDNRERQQQKDIKIVDVDIINRPRVLKNSSSLISSGRNKFERLQMIRVYPTSTSSPSLIENNEKKSSPIISTTERASSPPNKPMLPTTVASASKQRISALYSDKHVDDHTDPLQQEESNPYPRNATPATLATEGPATTSLPTNPQLTTRILSTAVVTSVSVKEVEKNNATQINDVDLDNVRIPEKTISIETNQNDNYSGNTNSENYRTENVQVDVNNKTNVASFKSNATTVTVKPTTSSYTTTRTTTYVPSPTTTTAPDHEQESDRSNKPSSTQRTTENTGVQNEEINTYEARENTNNNSPDFVENKEIDRTTHSTTVLPLLVKEKNDTNKNSTSTVVFNNDNNNNESIISMSSINNNYKNNFNSTVFKNTKETLTDSTTTAAPTEKTKEVSKTRIENTSETQTVVNVTDIPKETGNRYKGTVSETQFSSDHSLGNVGDYNVDIKTGRDQTLYINEGDKHNVHNNFETDNNTDLNNNNDYTKEVSDTRTPSPIHTTANKPTDTETAVIAIEDVNNEEDVDYSSYNTYNANINKTSTAHVNNNKWTTSTTRAHRHNKTIVSHHETSDVGVAYPENISFATYVLSGLGVIPVLLLAVMAARLIVLRNRKKKVLDESEYSSEYNRSPLGATSPSLHTKLPRLATHMGWEVEKTKLPPIPATSPHWEFPRDKLRLQTVLGQGFFGQVWKAEADDISGHEGLTRLVAVKTVKEGASSREREDLLRELGIMQELGSHPNVVTLLGCCTEKEPYLLIMEYVMYGKMLAFLRDHRTRAHYYNFSDATDALTSRDLTVFAYCVARGMDYLTSKSIIHRDLAARNVLVDHNKLCKIADFGMSRNVRDTGQIYEQRQCKGVLPIRWMAPESLHFSLFTHKTDVWSFGILMWEIVTLGSTPYATMGAREVMRRVREGYRLERPSHCHQELFRVIARCWHSEPAKRPTFAELKQELGQLLGDTEHGGGYVDLDGLADEMRHQSQSSRSSTLQRPQHNH